MIKWCLPRTEHEPMTSVQLEYSSEELMSEDSYENPLYGGDVLCHGGYINNQYVSPRGKVRRPAIESWRARLADEAGGQGAAASGASVAGAGGGAEHPGQLRI